MTDTAVALRPEQALAENLANESKLELLRNTVATGLNNNEFALFIEVARTKGLDPFSGQIHALKRGSGQNEKLSIQTGIDGLRLVAIRTGEYEGRTRFEWCGDDGVWVDVWLGATPPAAARVGVRRKGFVEPIESVALFREYAQYTGWDEKRRLNNMWATKGALMLAKCAESAALRAAFPAEMSGLYSDDEMAQADNQPVNEQPAPKNETRSQARKDLGAGMAKAENEARGRAQEKAAAPDHAKALAALPEWMGTIYTIVIDNGHKLSELAPVVGAPPTPRAFNEWGERMTKQGIDPYKEMRKHVDALLAPPPPADPETGEVIEGEVVSEEAGPAMEAADEEPFE